MTIDRSSATELELVVNARSGNQQCSLFGVMNRTKTAVGARLLRSNILNPCTDVPTILERSNLASHIIFSSSIKSPAASRQRGIVSVC
jgi:DNA mismatch repair protein MSH4